MTIHKQIFKSVLLLVVSLAMMSFKTADERAAEVGKMRVCAPRWGAGALCCIYNYIVS
jgi:hypothetical protein